MKYRDRRTAGNSALVPFMPGESPSDRHARRLQVNTDHMEEVRNMAADRGLTLKDHNLGQQWTFTKTGFVCDWWPSSAKLVINKQWRRGIHAHDWRQAFREIDRALGRST